MARYISHHRSMNDAGLNDADIIFSTDADSGITELAINGITVKRILLKELKSVKESLKMHIYFSKKQK